jgi:perosamine synthetase
MIPVLMPSVGDEEVAAIKDVLDSRWLGLGPKTAEFEEAFASYLGVGSCVAVNSCTAALDMAMKLCGIGPGDEVILPTITFVSTAHAVVYNGGTPVFADVDEVTLNIDPEDVARKLSPRTKAVVVVHYGGRIGPIRELREVTDAFLIEDAAHACGSSAAPFGERKKAGAFGDAACFSFHAVKNLAMGDGGALVASLQAHDGRARRLRWLGIDKSTWDRAAPGSYWWEYEVDEVGLKCHMNDIAAAVGLVQLRKLDAANARRAAIARRYEENLRNAERVTLPPADTDDSQSSWHLYPIRHPRRDELAVHLRRNGVNTGVHYRPIHTYRCYGDGDQPSLPVAERVFSDLVSLPMFPDLTDAQVDMISELILAFDRR